MGGAGRIDDLAEGGKARSPFSAAGLWAMLRDYLGIGRSRRREPIVDRAGLGRFLDTRAAFVAQTSLYGYVRTRAGQRYPELFDDEPFVAAMNIAKWQIWLACLSDLAVFAGGRLAAGDPALAPSAGRLVQAVVAQVLEGVAVPPDAGSDFLAGADAVRARLAACDWAAVGEAEAAFVESPPALVRWAPVVDDLKQVDEPIVLNSVRFRWQEVRRDLQALLDREALLAAAG